MTIQNTKYKYSFSGSDTLIKASFEQTSDDEVQLNSVNTISISIHEQKSPVRRLGHAGVVGFTSSSRVIGGSIIMTAINGHPFHDLINSKISNEFLSKRSQKQRKDNFLPYESSEIDRANYLATKSKLGFFNNDDKKKSVPLCTALPPMRIRLVFVSEYDHDDKNNVGGYGEIIMNNVCFVSENIVMSVNNMVTEFVLQFVASDINEFQFFENTFADQSKPKQEG